MKVDSGSPPQLFLLRLSYSYGYICFNPLRLLALEQFPSQRAACLIGIHVRQDDYSPQPLEQPGGA